MKPYIVLSMYKPSKWRASIVGRELTDLTDSLGLVPHYDPLHGPLELTGRNWCSKLLHAEVRRRTFSTNQAEGWHYDADLNPDGNPDCSLVTWASNNSTQVKWRIGADTTIYQPRPYEVVIFKNLECLHRRPPNSPRVRWLFRQRVKTVDFPQCLTKLSKS